MNTTTNAIITVVMIACQMVLCCTLTPFRVPKRKAYWTIGIISAVECLIYILVAAFLSRDIAISIQTLLVIPTILIVLVFAKYRDGRFLFAFFFSDIVLGMLNLTVFMVVASTSLKNSMTMNILTRCGSLMLCSFVLVKWVAPRVRSMFEAEGVFWWMVGGAVFISDLFIYFIPVYPTSIEKRPEDFLVMCIINILLLQVFIVLIIAIYGMHKAQENRKRMVAVGSALTVSKLQLQQSERQYENILSTYEQIQKTRHDLRHHMLVIGGLCQNKDYEKLTQYVESYSKALPGIPKIQYCVMFEINVLLGYYDDLCRDEHIAFSCMLQFGEVGVKKPVHLCIILGNALENAVDACRLVEEPAKRFIEIQGLSTADDTIVLSIKNSFDGTVRTDEKGNFISRKSTEGHGLGIQSMIQIAEKNMGWCNITYDKEVFMLQAMLRT